MRIEGVCAEQAGRGVGAKQRELSNGFFTGFQEESNFKQVILLGPKQLRDSYLSI